ncbi:hypothetical protein ACFSCW_13400 [Sphingomonas tabacisoli]|uniref:Uncharacterized protein n=1 Tax=Sphingomonas tabacisoli TaxID=2249466 RepID=A0ABW4I5X5_9SPHN
MRTTLAALVLGMGGPALAASPLVGSYDGHQMEVAAGLDLNADGTFQYGLSYGALDEQAKGRWMERDGKVLLTTEPAPKRPTFTVVSDTPSSDGKLIVALDKPEALGGVTLTVRVTFKGSDKPMFLEVGEDGTVPLPRGLTPVAVVPDLPIYDVPLDPYPLKDVGRTLIFRFEPNDLGVADFRDEPLIIDNGQLVMRRYDRTLTFRKEGK